MNGELLDGTRVLASLASEVRDISSYATFVVRNDEYLSDELARITAVQPAVAGRRAGVNIPDFLASGKSGRSRKEWLMRHNAVTACRSWQERDKAANGESSKYVSQGWKRTANGSAPSYGVDYVNLGAVDKQYAVIENNPLTDGEIVLKMVIQGQWYRLIFGFDNERFTEGRVTLPVIKVEGGQPVFIFTVVTDNPVVQFSGDYTIGVDVGINNYTTVVVRDTKTGRIVYETTLSQRVHSLWNSVRASEVQVRSLKAKAATLLHDRQGRMSALDEARLHREAASRKKRELAILAAQEIADLSHPWGNAVVAVEDLSWIVNTMQNGRWNRGELVKWLTHYAQQNGGWVVAVNPANTSQLCYKCGAKVTHPTHEVSVCAEHGTMDRDVNAAANIAARAVLVHVDDDGMAHLFKATDSDGMSHRGGAYRVGEVVDDSANWTGDRFFGGGLHVSPSPSQALVRSQLDEREGVRFFEVTCPVSELVSIADDVCKAPRLRVVREVDVWGEPL